MNTRITLLEVPCGVHTDHVCVCAYIYIYIYIYISQS